MKDNHPTDALRVSFKTLMGKTVKYYIWPKGKLFYWSTRGQSGKEESQEAAMRAAREYILNGVSGMASLRQYHGVLNEGRSQSN